MFTVLNNAAFKVPIPMSVEIRITQRRPDAQRVRFCHEIYFSRGVHFFSEIAALIWLDEGNT
jgi:hypothetical protein